MRKILITGMNKNQCTEDFYLSQQLKVVPSHYSLIRCLRDMGYEVEQRVVKIGEDLSSYEDVIVYIHNPSGFAGYVYNALYAIHSRPDCILAFDDWQTDSIYSGLLALKNPDKLFRQFVVDSHNDIPPNIKDYQNMLLESLSIIESKKNRMLISAFSGGDLSLLIDYPKDKLFSFNPNPYHLNRRPNFYSDTGAQSVVVELEVEQNDKEHKFNFASLMQDKTAKWLKNQNITWPIDFFGSKKEKQVRLTEGEMCRVFAKQWGCLMPGYFHAGSGWWRARPLQVADAGSILIGDPKEMMLYYRCPEVANVKASDIEAMDNQQRQMFAKRQRDAIYICHPLDKSVQQQELKTVLEAK